MFTKPTPSFAPASGFVAFDDSSSPPGAIAVPIAKSPYVVHMPSPAPVEAANPLEPGLYQSSTWQPRASARVRWIEGAVIVALCGYFAIGAAAAFKLF